MGVVYKITPAIKNFIIEQKQANPRLGCRKLVDMIKEKFSTAISKSSVNNVIKEAKLSSPVGRRSKKTSKEDQFKIPTAKKQQLLTETKRYIDDSLLSSPKKNKALNKNDTETKQDPGDSLAEKNVVVPSKNESANISNDENNVNSDTLDSKLQGKETENVQSESSLTWEPVQDDIISDESNELEDDALPLRPDPVQQEPNQQEKNTNYITKDIKTSTEMDLVRGRVFSHMGGVLFKAVQWYISHKPIFYNALRSKLNNMTENDVWMLADWLPSAKIFNHDLRHLDNGALSEAETYFYDNAVDARMVDFVRQYAAIEDIFGLGLDLMTDINMAFTLVSKVGLTLSSSKEIVLNPDLTGLAHEHRQACPALLDRVLNQVPDCVLNNIEPLYWGNVTEDTLYHPEFISLCRLLSIRDDEAIREVALYGMNDEVLMTFNSITKQKRNIIFGLDPKSVTYQSVMKDEEGWSGSKRIQFADNTLDIRFGRQAQYEDCFYPVRVSSALFDQDIIVLTNIDLNNSELYLIVRKWVMRFSSIRLKKKVLFAPDIPTMMPVMDVDHYVQQIRDLIYDYFVYQFYPKQMSDISLQQFIADIALLPVLVIELKDVVFLIFSEQPSAIQPDDFQALLDQINTVGVCDVSGKMMHFLCKK